VQLTYPAPDNATAILDGTQPQGLTSAELRKANVPVDWAVQRRLLGFPPPRRALDLCNLFGAGYPSIPRIPFPT
jgi:site-specific DNA recombinase